jgi:hypothetical protein
MAHATVVRYTTRPERADENEQLIRAVFAQLAEEEPDGIRYSAFRLDDQVSFVHVAVLDSDTNPLSTLSAFTRFVSTVGERCVEGPTATDGTQIGSYRMSDTP